MSELVERIAEAIYRAQWPDGNRWPDECDGPLVSIYRDQAEAVIKALDLREEGDGAVAYPGYEGPWEYRRWATPWEAVPNALASAGGAEGERA